MRFWPLKDRTGVAVPDTYLMSMDSAGINYDYNDNLYLISNLRPEGEGTALFRLDVGGASNYVDSLGRTWQPEHEPVKPVDGDSEGLNAARRTSTETVDDPIYRPTAERRQRPLDQRILTYESPSARAPA